MATQTLAPPTQAAPEIDSRAPAPATPARRSRRRVLGWILIALVALLLVAGAVFAHRFYRDSQQYVSTDNAQLSGTPIDVGSMNAGRIAQLNVKVGDHVARGQLLAQVALPSQTGVAQNGQPELDFLGSADSRTNVQAPIDGVVIATPVAVGATVAAGESIVQVVDPTQLWVNANVDETAVDRVRVGQPAIVHVDALNTDVDGTVDAITPATAATFSMLPSNSSSGTFSKVTQLVPVRIQVRLNSQTPLLGTSVEVRIRVAD